MKIEFLRGRGVGDQLMREAKLVATSIGHMKREVGRLSALLSHQMCAIHR